MLDKVIDVDAAYRAESDKAYVVRKAGTSSTTEAILKVGGIDSLKLVDKIAAIMATHLSLFPAVDLGDLFVVIPPDKEFSFTGSAGSKMRLSGQILELSPGEVLSTTLLARYGEQGRRYLRYETGSFSKGTDTDWPADEENEVWKLTSPAGERHTLKRILYADIANLSAAHGPGDWALRLYRQDAPLDILDTTMGDPGIDLWNLEYIYDTTEYHGPFSIADMPQVLEPGRKLSVNARNVSGASKSPGAGTSITVTLILLDEIELLS